jgi:hypothetical protein
MIPTSVTTAVMLDGGVRSYSGFKISRFSSDSSASVSRALHEGKVESRAPTGAARPAVSVHAQRRRLGRRLTELVLGEAVELDALGELVRLAADEERDGDLLRHHRDERGARAREDGAIGVQRVRADERERHLGDDGAERREQEVRARDRGRSQHGQQLLAWRDIR